MRNIIRFISLMLSIVMLCGMIPVFAGAAEAGDYEDAAKRLSAVGILKGDGKGNLSLGALVKRWQTALFFMQVLTGITEADKLNAVKGSDYFSDVTDYGTAIDMAYAYGVVKGHDDGTYGYNDNIIYQDMLVMAVRALGYETEGMVYPLGHIIAADELGITENIKEGTAHNKPLTRGETSQIIWNTLNIDIAVKNPATGKPIYPDANDPSRQTYLEKSNFTQGKLEGVIVEYTPAVKSTDVETVTVKIDGQNEIFKAEDLGIDYDVFQNEYLNLPVTLYINYKTAGEFFANYDYTEDENKGKIVIWERPEFDYASNIGDEGNIKYVATPGKTAYLELNGEKYATDKYNFDIRKLDKVKGWLPVDPVEQELEHSFLYDTKSGYIGSNSYGEVQFTVIPTEVKDENPTLLILYTPYAFGRYASHTNIKYEPEGAKANIVTIATYEPSVSGYYNFSGNSTKFVEYTLGGTTGVNNYKIESGELSVNASEGKLSYSVLVDDEFGCTTNDYVLYYYNQLDNVLKIVYNCGPAKSGLLTGYSADDRTVRIDGKNYKFGFPGSFATNLPMYTGTNQFENNFQKNFINKMHEGGQDNAYFITVGDNVVYTIYKGYNPSDVSPYVITTLDSTVIAELMELTVAEFNEKSTIINSKRFLFNENGIVVARLDTSSGEWSLDTVTTVETYNNTANTYTDSASLSAYALQAELLGRVNVDTALTNMLSVIDDGILILREEGNDGMTVAKVPTTSTYADHKDIIDYFSTSAGLTVSDTGAKTNRIKATNNSDTQTGRKTFTSKSVVVVIDNAGNVYIRKAANDSSATITKEAMAINDTFSCNIYAATNNLVVMHAHSLNLSSVPLRDITHKDKPIIRDENGNEIKFMDNWMKGPATTADEGYYVVTKDSKLAYEANGDETFTVTLTNAYNLIDLSKETITLTVDSLSDDSAKAIINNFAIGKILHKTTADKYEVSSYNISEAYLEAANLASDKDETLYNVDLATLDFEDFESITATLKNGSTTVRSLTKADAIVGIDVKVATIDLTSFVSDDYDYTELALDKSKYDPAGVAAIKYTDDAISTVKFNENGDKYYSYSILRKANIVTVTEPTEGIFDNYILKTSGAKLHIPENDDSLFEDAKEICVNVYVCGRFDEETGKLELQVLRVISDFAE